MGWLQDLSSEFSIKRITDLKDPHKWAEHYLTKGFQEHVGNFALNFMGPWGKAGAAALETWQAHEAQKGVYGGKTGQTPKSGTSNLIEGAADYLGASAIQGSGSSSGSGGSTSGGGGLGGLGSLLGGSGGGLGGLGGLGGGATAKSATPTYSDFENSLIANASKAIQQHQQQYASQNLAPIDIGGLNGQ